MLEDACNDKYIDKYMIKLKQREAPGRARITRSKRDNIIIDNDACAYDISKISKIN
jgi:hypothetical protein